MLLGRIRGSVRRAGRVVGAGPSEFDSTRR